MVRRGWVTKRAAAARTSLAGAAICGSSWLTLLACADGASPASSGAQTDDWAARAGTRVLSQAVVAAGLAVDPEATAALANFGLATALHTHEPASAGWLSRVALAHALGDDLAAQARAQGPVTDDELALWTDVHWLGVDRPPAFRTTHVVVVVDAKATDAERASARALAERIHEAVADAASLDDFRAQATAIAAGSPDVKIEDLEPVVADGRVVRLGVKAGVPTGNYDEAFARAACALQRLGETSPVVASSFGFHVMRLVEIVPELRFSAEQRRELAARDVYDQRAREQLKTLVAAGRQRDSAAVERSAEEATARVSVE